MAYNNSPENSTYKTVNLEFTATSWPRGNNSALARDVEIINMFYDRNSNENQTRDFVLVKRPGLESTGINLNKSLSTDTINGYFQDSTTGKIYWSVNNKVWRWDGSSVTEIASMGGTTPSGMNSVGFCLFLTAAGTRYLCINNGSQLWYHDVTTSSSTQVVDADYPTPTSPHMVYLDGYLFVIKSDTGDIYNSDLNTIVNWTPGNYVTTEINPDFAATLAKVKNYLVCFGNDGIEFFYDAANVSGSPLGRNESYYQSIILQSSVCNIEDTLFFIGRAANNSVQFYTLDGNKAKAVSPSWVNRYLAALVGTSYGTSEINNILCFAFSSNGHHFVGINLGANFILVYDIDHGFWYKWSLGSAFNTTSNRVELALKSLDEDQVLFATGGQTTLAALDEAVWQDFNTNFTCSYKTADYSAETFNWKSCSRVGVLCDQYQSTGTSNLQVSWSDDDGGSYSTPRNINVFSQNPYLTQTGRFRSRTWKLEYTDAYPFRMWSISMDLNVGSI